MPRLFRVVASLLTNQFFWTLDYAYVVRKQFISIVIRTVASDYRNDHTSLPSIILIPGIYENWQFMKPIAQFLYQHNYDVHVVESLGYNRDSIEAMANVISQYIKYADKEFILVAHSKGGLIGKYLLVHFNDKKKLKGMITLNTPFSGSRYAYLFLLFKQLRIFIPNSSILKYLSQNQDVNQHIVSIYGKFDPHIPDGSKLEGAKNIRLNTYGHFRIMNDHAVHETLVRELRRMKKSQEK